MPGYIDIHHHIVYGIDDGPQTAEDSLRMLEAAARNGVTHIIATSHATPSMERFPLERYYRHLDLLNEACQKRALGLTLYDGCEVFYSDIALRQLAERRLPTLAGSRFALVEFDPTHGFDVIEQAIRQLGNAGFIPVVAHCERYAALVRNVDEALDLRQKYRMRYQVNAATILERRCPRPVRKFRDALLRTGALDYIASDAHNTSGRAVNMGEGYHALAKAYGHALAEEWTGGRQREIFEEG